MKNLNKTITTALALTFSFMLLVGGYATAQAQETSREAASPPQDSVQVVEITVSSTGFSPNQIDLKAGVPARLIFTRTAASTCATQVQIPAFDIEKTDLPLNEPVAIEFTPSEAGTFTFLCGLNMMEGAIVVES